MINIGICGIRFIIIDNFIMTTTTTTTIIPYLMLLWRISLFPIKLKYPTTVIIHPYDISLLACLFNLLIRIFDFQDDLLLPRLP
jgi:hypothetical protein